MSRDTGISIYRLKQLYETMDLPPLLSDLKNNKNISEEKISKIFLQTKNKHKHTKNSAQKISPKNFLQGKTYYKHINLSNKGVRDLAINVILQAIKDEKKGKETSRFFDRDNPGFTFWTSLAGLDGIEGPAVRSLIKERKVL